RVPIDGVFPLAPSFDHVGPLAADVAGCVAATAALAPELEPRTLGSLEEVTVAVAWIDECDPLVRARVGEAAALFPRRREIELPEPHGTSDAFMREIADVHRELFAENAELYGDNVRPKFERCLAVTDSEARAAAATREAYRQR